MTHRLEDLETQITEKRRLLRELAGRVRREGGGFWALLRLNMLTGKLSKLQAERRRLRP